MLESRTSMNSLNCQLQPAVHLFWDSHFEELAAGAMAGLLCSHAARMSPEGAGGPALSRAPPVRSNSL